ncbi:hypothetical protein F5878DRAFT_89134 [Lentinula raphanica]|uniref:Uncharacterized protein n=1 Tax=Lentinula raphanica TaxID=153919 RepID=A0AA38PCI5_9AGAR|nr:hypothetical protein F5878DRAFT_89134 [Lentinula raphanica]
MRSMQAFIKDLPFYIIRLWSFYVQYFPPTFTDSWRRARLLPVALESLAHSTPNRVYACIPRSEDVEKDGFRDVTYKQLLNAVDAAAWWLDSEDVFSNERGQVFTYVGPRDLRYAILLLASIKTGRVVSLLRGLPLLVGRMNPQAALLNVTSYASTYASLPFLANRLWLSTI